MSHGRRLPCSSLKRRTQSQIGSRAALPDLLSRTLEEGVANVHVIGCPVDDCANREGNI
jgi:coenzyme F420-reducing hydrogenase delta subunit